MLSINNIIEYRLMSSRKNIHQKSADSSDDLERLRDEKDQEIQILQESLDSTIQRMSEAQHVSFIPVTGQV